MKQVTAAESPWQAGITEANGRAFKMVFKKMLDSTTPDVMELAGSGATQSPTVSQMGPMLSCQRIVSNGWDLELGDI